MADNENSELPYSSITKIPDTEPDAIPELWNKTYREIDENFNHLKSETDALRNQIESGEVASAKKAEKDSNGNVIHETYAPLSHLAGLRFQVNEDDSVTVFRGEANAE